MAGLTPAAAAAAIQNGLIAAHYMRHPVVQVTVTQYATQNVSVLGEVKAPGPYPTGTPRSILDVLAMAGGLDQVADRNILIERHGDPANLVHYYYSNNADKAVEGQVLVNPGDTVIVPKAGIVYVLGDVNRPGGYAMVNNESKMSLLEALALAGGVSKTAKEGHARLIRKQNWRDRIPSGCFRWRSAEGQDSGFRHAAGRCAVSAVQFREESGGFWLVQYCRLGCFSGGLRRAIGVWKM